jgi:hypothetical protein
MHDPGGKTGLLWSWGNQCRILGVEMVCSDPGVINA